MAWSQVQQSEDLYNQIMIMIGSAVRLLGGERGVFVISNEAFDPQSSFEYVLYRLAESGMSLLLSHMQEGKQPGLRNPLVSEKIAPELATRCGIEVQAQHTECCSLALYDADGSLGILHLLRPAGYRSCIESGEQGVDAGRGGVVSETLSLYIAQLAASMRFALKAQSLVKEQGRLAAIFQNSTEGILTVDNALRIIDFNPAMERLTGWREREVLGQF